MGLGVSIVFAVLFVGFAFVYRLEVGPSLSAQVVAGGPPVPTLRPTFTPAAPTPGATPTAPAAAEATAGETPQPAAATATPAPVPERPPAASPPTRLVIARLGLDIPVVPVGIKTIQIAGRSRVVWGDAAHAGAFHETSAYPGNGGNTVINGHRDIHGSVFRHLDELEVGDPIVLYVGDVAYRYTVAETVVVPETFATASQRAAALQLIGPMAEERLTLITCTPLHLATHRLLVIARPSAGTDAGLPQAGATATP